MKKSLLLISVLALGAVTTLTAIGLHNNGFRLAIADTATTSHTITFAAKDIAVVDTPFDDSGYCELTLSHKVDTSDDALDLFITAYGSILDGDTINEDGHILTLEATDYGNYAEGSIYLGFSLFSGVQEVNAIHLNGDFSGPNMDHWSQIKVEKSYPDAMPTYSTSEEEWQANIYIDSLSSIALDSIEITYSC